MCSAVAENTDNLLSNGNFSNQLNDWVVEDATKTKHDANCYAGGTDASGLCKSVRWSSNQGKTISQTIDNLDPGYDINNINVSFTALGCNNEANSSTWCSQGTDYDKVQATIQLSNDVSHETLYLEQQLDYNDGTQDYNLSTQTLSDWTTDNTTIDFSITGIDTGNWNGWYAPIVDNINLNLTISETPVAVIEPMVIEPTIAEPQVIENTVIQGLDLETELITDVILDMPIDLPVDTQLVSVDLPEIDDMVIEEPVIEINEPIVEEVQIEEDVAEGGGEVEGETTESNESTSEEIEEEVAQETSEETSEEEESPEPKSTPEPKVASKKVDTKSVPKTTASVKKNTGFKQIDIVNLVTLTKIQETIKIQETVSLIQEQIYEQSIDLIASDITIDGIIGDTSRWRDSVVGQRYQYEVTSYRRSGQ